MIKSIHKIVVLFLIVIGVWSCNNNSEMNYYYPSSFYRSNQLQPENIAQKPYQATNKRDSANMTIGWHPYYLEDAYLNYDFSLLESVIFHGYEWGGDNSEAVIDEWYKTSMVEDAQTVGCKVIFSASNYGALKSTLFFDSLKVQEQFMDKIFTYLKMKDADGIELDFPAVSAEHRINFSQFIKTFYIRLKQINSEAVLYVSLPFFDKNNAFDIRAISPYVDLFILGGNNSANSNYDLLDNEPIAPIENPYENDSSSISAAFKHYNEKGINPFKLILELPYYTTVKQQETRRDTIPKLKIELEPVIIIDTISFIDTVITDYYHDFYSYENFLKTYEEKDILFDKMALSSYINIDNPNGSGNIKYYFDDSTSIGAKYDWALNHGFRGVGIWALGFDNNHTEMWQMLDDRSSKQPSLVATNIPFSIGSYFHRNKKMFQVWLTFILGIIVFGIIIAMLYWKSRDGLTALHSFRFYLIIIAGLAIFLFLTRILFQNLIFQTYPISVTIIGIMIGLLLTYFINILIDYEIQKEP
jgi:hypothetical protein